MTISLPSDLQSATPEALARLLEQIVASEYAYVRRVAFSILNDPVEAEDAVQETFIAVSRWLPDFRGEASLRTWVAHIAVNACRRRLRRSRSQQSLVRRLGERQAAQRAWQARPAGPESAAELREANRLLWQAVDALDEKHRLPLVLRYVHEFELAEIALMLELPLGTLHSRLYYARQKLQGLLGMSGIREELFNEPDTR